MIRFLQPHLPPVEELAPFVERCDTSHTYSNFGPLEEEFRKRCGQYFQCDPDEIVTFANGTLALTLALIGLELPNNSLCLMPAWTFPATVSAIVAAGLEPFYVDVDRETWALSPQHCRELIRHHPVSSIVVVAPFGAPLDHAAWLSLQEDLGVQVVVDGAAGFASLTGGALLPTMISLHATKIFGIGEGGLLLCPNAQYAAKLRRLSNFGFDSNRHIASLGVNAKLSEYGAAIGLATFGRWQAQLAQYKRLALIYRTKLEAIPGVTLQTGFGVTWVSGTLVCCFADPCAHKMADFLADRGIETRFVWGQGCHRHQGLVSYQQEPLPHTESLSQHTLALPFHLGMTLADICSVVESIQEAREGRTGVVEDRNQKASIA